MPSRKVDFPVFDADNHMYETADAFTKFLPAEYAGLINYVEVHGRTKIAVKGLISEYIPNPTFARVAAPGAQEEYFKIGNPEGKSRREIMGKPIRRLPGLLRARAPAGAHGRARHRPGPDVADAGQPARGAHARRPAGRPRRRPRPQPVDARALDLQLREPDLPHPRHHPGIVDQAIEELDWVVERGAQIVLIRPAPAWGYRGPRSPALPEFDPFWERLAEAGILSACTPRTAATSATSTSGRACATAR